MFTTCRNLDNPQKMGLVDPKFRGDFLNNLDNLDYLDYLDNLKLKASNPKETMETSLYLNL